MTNSAGPEGQPPAAWVWSHYRGVAPDTFTDGVDIVVEGRLDANGVFQATTLLAKCASRYENAPGQPGQYPPGAKHPDNVPKA